jgi:hypothetical protein
MKAKNKTTLKYTLIGFGALALILILLSFAVQDNSTQTSYFYSKELGLITTKIGSSNFLSKLFHPTEEVIVFTPSSATAGETISIRDDYVVKAVGDLDMVIGSDGKSEYIRPWSLIYLKNGQQIATETGQYTKPYGVGTNLWINSEFTPPTAGTFSGKTYYYIVRCYPNVPNPTGCQSVSSNCKYHSDCKITSLSSNNVIISESICTKTPDSDYSWVKQYDITGGYIEQGFKDIVTSACEYKTLTQWRTNCNSGYHISGTTSNTVGAGKLTCDVDVIVPLPTPDCSGNQHKCVGNILYTCTPSNTWGEVGASPPNVAPDGSFCTTPECDVDQKQICTDGTQIITRICDLTTHTYTDTTNKCPIIGCTEDKTEICSDGITITTSKCTNSVLTPTGNKCHDENCTEDVKDECDDETTVITSKCINNILVPTDEICPAIQPKQDYLLYIIIGATTILFVVVVYLFIKRIK